MDRWLFFFVRRSVVRVLNGGGVRHVVVVSSSRAVGRRSGRSLCKGGNVVGLNEWTRSLGHRGTCPFNKKSNFSCRILRRNSTKDQEYLQKLGWDQRIITMTETNEREKRYELTLPRPYARLLHNVFPSQSLPLTPYRAVKMRELYKIISWHVDGLSTYLQAKNWGLFNTFR